MQILTKDNKKMTKSTKENHVEPYEYIKFDEKTMLNKTRKNEATKKVKGIGLAVGGVKRSK